MTRRQLAAALLAAVVAPPPDSSAPVRTGKERLSDKASEIGRASCRERV